MSDAAAPRRAKPLSGRHFAAWLSCPQRAWHELFSDARLKAPDPGYLVALQLEGLAFERSASAAHFPNAEEIPSRLPDSERHRRTVAAMTRGVPAVFQGCLTGPDAIGVVDVLELVGTDAASATGHLYRVGEFKRATAIKTAHVFQVTWYDDLLRTLQGRSSGDGFVVLGDGTRRNVDLASSRAAYEATRARLLALRMGSEEPGPHLISDCPSCPWRSLCLPRLVAESHVSLVPGIGRERAQHLAEAGVCSWHDLATRRGAWPELAITDAEAARFDAALADLAAGRPVIRHGFRVGALAALRVVALELERQPGERRPRPAAVYFEDRGRVEAAPVRRVGDHVTVDLAGLPADATLAFYGEADTVGFQRLARAAGQPLMKYVDVLEVVQSLVHAPLPGLELETLVRAAGGTGQRGPLGGRDRVSAIRRVLTWLDAASREAA